MSESPCIAFGGRRLTWRLRELMEARGIKSASELHRLLKNVDPDAVGFAQFARIIDNPPVRLTLKTLLALTIVLDCQVADILNVVGPD